MRLNPKKSVIGWSALTLLALGLAGEARAQSIYVRRPYPPVYAPYYRPTTVVRERVRTYVAPPYRRPFRRPVVPVVPYRPPAYGTALRSTTITTGTYVAPRPYPY